MLAGSTAWEEEADSADCGPDPVVLGGSWVEVGVVNRSGGSEVTDDAGPPSGVVAGLVGSAVEVWLGGVVGGAVVLRLVDGVSGVDGAGVVVVVLDVGVADGVLVTLLLVVVPASLLVLFDGRDPPCDRSR